MKFLPDLKYHSEAIFDTTHLVCKLWVRKVQKRKNSLLFCNAITGHLPSQKFEGLSILTSEINHENI